MSEQLPIYHEGSGSTFSYDGVNRYLLDTLFELTLNRPAEEVPTDTLAWMIPTSKITLPDGRNVCRSCSLKYKDSEKEVEELHKSRVDNTDLNVPLLVTRQKDKWLVVDGEHRLEKAVAKNLPQVGVKILSDEDLQKAKV